LGSARVAYRNLIVYSALDVKHAMELDQYILSLIEEMLHDAASDEGRFLVQRDAQQLVVYLNSKFTDEERRQILTLLKDEDTPERYPDVIQKQATALVGWLKTMRSTVNRKPIEKDHLSELIHPPIVNPAFILTVAGPMLGGFGWWFELQWLYWLGVLVSSVTLFLNLASGLLKSPVIPVILMIGGAFLMDPWYLGAGAGLLIWTGLEALGEIIGRIFR